MDEENRKIYLFGADAQGEFDLEDILEEYRDEQQITPEIDEESLLDRSKRIVMEKLGDDCCSVGFASLEDVIEDAVAEAYPEPEPEAEAEPEPKPEPEPEPVVFSEEEEELIEELQREAERAEAYAVSDDDGQTEYASGAVEYTADEIRDNRPDRAEVSEDDAEETPAERRANRRSGEKSGRERFLSPLVAVMALIALRRSQHQKEEDKRRPDAAEEVPEM